MSDATLDAHARRFASQAIAVSDRDGVDELRRAWLGRKGALKDLMSRMRDIAPEGRRAYGQGVNQLKQSVAAR